MPEPTQATEPAYYLPIVGETPGMAPETLEIYAPPGTLALVIESNTHAALADRLHPVIKKITAQGTAVFLLADNYAYHLSGITELYDEPQRGILAAGAYYLETIGRETINDPAYPNQINSANLAKVIDAIKAAIDEGFTGRELGEHVREQFSYPPGERPVREVSVEALRRHEQKLIAGGLGGLGLTNADGVFVGEVDEAEQ